MAEKMKVQFLAPQDLKVPEVRITSTFDDEIYSMFKDDIEKTGISQPLLVAKHEDNLWVIDGKNRRDEALLQGLKTIPCIVVEMSIKDLQLRNLVMNRLRGRTKVSEEVSVIRDLWEKHSCGIEEIVEKTGMAQERVEQLLQIGGAAPEVWEALDAGRIKVCHAFQLARIVDRGPQVRMLEYIRNVRTNCKDLKEAVDDALRMIKERATEEKKPEALGPAPLPVAKCSICKQDHPVNEMVAPPMCKTCFAYAITAHDERKGPVEVSPEKRSPIAEAILGGQKEPEGGS